MTNFTILVFLTKLRVSHHAYSRCGSSCFISILIDTHQHNYNEDHLWMQQFSWHNIQTRIAASLKWRAWYHGKPDNISSEFMSVFEKKQCLPQWSNSMASDSHPEPSPVWIFGWPWENKPWWKYEIVDDTVDDDDNDDDCGDDSEDVTCPLSEVHWQAVAKVFEPLHYINNDHSNGSKTLGSVS